MTGGMQTKMQVSAGGVAFRESGGRFEVALISVGPTRRWQLPKGLVDEGERPEEAALREVREEAGVEAELVDRLDTIEYWYVSTWRGERVRFHKFVHFYLMRYAGGSVADHDHEVNEARWFGIEEASAALAFANERKVIELARRALGIGEA
jgi:8-oxo-dGTP pyrophosphatase MutT (NUDIX family)